MRRPFFNIYCTFFSNYLLNSIFIVLKRISIIQNCNSRRLNSISNHQNQTSIHPRGTSGELNRTSIHQNCTCTLQNQILGELNHTTGHQHQISHTLLSAYSTLNRFQHHLKASYYRLSTLYNKQNIFSWQTHKFLTSIRPPTIWATTWTSWQTVLHARSRYFSIHTTVPAWSWIWVADEERWKHWKYLNRNWFPLSGVFQGGD